MTTNKTPVNIVWFKRDLRLHDNEALHNALNAPHKTLLVYCFEPLLLNDPHYSNRHWNFIKQSLVDLNKTLSLYQTKILCVTSDIIPLLQALNETFDIKHIFSHQETGINATFERDKKMKRFVRNNMIQWTENINNGVQRGSKNRAQWVEKWNDFMNQDCYRNALDPNQFIPLQTIKELESQLNTTTLDSVSNPARQQGGRSQALKYLDSFLNSRHKTYTFNISKPLHARTSCSRLSPYLAWGNLSVREVYQATKPVVNSKNSRHLNAFLSRLRWQAHFIQKFEMEFEMEFVSINKGYRKLVKKVSKAYQKAWQEGRTGFPLVDACMRCLNETGYLNFRMRAMVVSFYTHHLWQSWQSATTYLSQQFLDFEPGIHFPQLQMQAGETGVNTLRIYNPVKNSYELDPEGEFIKKWVPELQDLEYPFFHEPWKMTTLEQAMNQFFLDDNYPQPVVDIKTSRLNASSILWGLRKEKAVREDAKRIKAKHINNPNRSNR